MCSAELCKYWGLEGDWDWVKKRLVECLKANRMMKIQVS